MLEACAQTHFVPLQDSLYIVHNSLLTTSQGAQCPYSLHTWHRFELGGSCTHSWQVTQALPRGHAGHLHLGNNNNKEKPPSTAAVATGTQGQGKRNIIGLPLLLSLCHAYVTINQTVLQADEMKYCRQFFLLSWKQLLSGFFLF